MKRHLEILLHRQSIRLVRGTRFDSISGFALVGYSVPELMQMDAPDSMPAGSMEQIIEGVIGETLAHRADWGVSA